jgi:hypothetical protein
MFEPRMFADPVLFSLTEFRQRASPHNAGPDFGHGGIPGIYRRESCSQNQTSTTGALSQKNGDPRFAAVVRRIVPR